MTTKTYRIPDFKLESFKEKIATMNKKVEKLQKKGYDVKPITYKVGTVEKVKRIVKGVQFDAFLFPVEVEADVIKANGWEFVATLQHEDAGVIVRGVPGMTSEGELAPFRNAKPLCNHCGYARKRNDTFILRSVEA